LSNDARREGKLILRALSGEHLHGFLPGNDQKAAISRAVGTHHEWAGGNTYGRVTRRGIETFDSLDAMFGGSHTLVIPWPEMLDIVARGCGDGRREAYEAAFAKWKEWAADDGYKITSAKQPSDEELEARYERWNAVTEPLHATQAAIISAGCERQTLQPELF
jgi:hypothetical protein